MTAPPAYDSRSFCVVSAQGQCTNRRVSWRRFGAAGGVAVALVCPAALAEPLALTWNAPAECPQVAAAEARVRRLAGAAPTAEAAELVASVTIAKTAENRWSATLTLGASTRVLDGESCEGVAEAAIVILAMAMEPQSARQPQPEPANVAEPEPEPAATAPVAAAPAPPAAERVSEAAAASVSAPRAEAAPWGASLRSFGEWGMLPAPSVGGVVAVHAAWGSHRVELSALGLLPRDAVLDEGTQGGEFSWFGFQLMGCQLLARPAFVCGGVEVGRLSGTGFGSREERTGHAFWAAPGIEALIAPALGNALSLDISAGIFIPLLKPQFAIEGVGVVHQPGPVSARVELGIGWY